MSEPDDSGIGLFWYPYIGSVGPLPPIPGIPGIPLIPLIDTPAPLAPVKRTPAAAAPFFLPPVNNTDRMVYRGPVRDALAVAPIIDGDEIFTALEKAIKGAESSVLIAFWSLDPQMKLVTDSSKTWLDLLKETADRGVMVRVLMNDFDAGLQLLPHASAWKAYIQMIQATETVPIDKFQVVCSRHPAETDTTIMAGVRPNLYDNIATEINSEPNANIRKNLFSVAPGLWDKLNLLPGAKLEPKVANKSYPASPGVHHQKLVIVDGKFAFTGGLNLNSSYNDNRKHDKPDLPWHDAFVKVEGSFILRDFVSNFIGLWNQERVRAEAFLINAYASLNIRVPPVTRATTDLAPSLIPTPLTSTLPPKILTQIHRTISQKGTAPTGVPLTVREDILEGYVQAISQANDFIYLENQYFREQLIADAIIKRHKDKRGLQVIIVIPKVIEEFLNSAGDELSQHGAAMQFDLLDTMKSKLGADLGLYAMVRKDNKLIYVHSKLCIIDDKYASIGSANSNPRSFRIDTELDLVWHNPDVTRKLRLDLWNEVLGTPRGLSSWSSSQFVSKWSAIASSNMQGRASAQKGFVMPFDNSNKGKKNPLLSPFT